jgi:hypothetical protein
MPRIAMMSCQQVHDLDAGDEDLRLGRLFRVCRRGLMDRPPLFGLHRTRLVNRLTDDVDDAAECLVANRH